MLVCVAKLSRRTLAKALVMSPGALATRIRMSRRQTLRLVARLEDAAELLVLHSAGRGNLNVVCTGASRKDLAAALDRAASFGAPLASGTLERTLTFLEAGS